jgi:hypothetical protein
MTSYPCFSISAISLAMLPDPSSSSSCSIPRNDGFFPPLQFSSLPPLPPLALFFGQSFAKCPLSPQVKHFPVTWFPATTQDLRCGHPSSIGRQGHNIKPVVYKKHYQHHTYKTSNEHSGPLIHINQVSQYSIHPLSRDPWFERTQTTFLRIP